MNDDLGPKKGISLIPPGLQGRLSVALKRKGLTLAHEGKVWQTWTCPELDQYGKIYRVATDRISIFDFVLNTIVPAKGHILNRLSMFWDEMLRREGILTHAVPQFEGILFNDKDFYNMMLGRGSIVQKLKMEPVECIVRGFLTGSGLASYNETGMICGHTLPKGLHDGDKLPSPIFTPTTKEDIGHDLHITEQYVIEKYGIAIKNLSLRAYKIMSAHAEEKGFYLADTKFECGRNEKGELVLADEIGTPDSSRFWKISDWEVAQKNQKSPNGWDKQFIRDWGKTLTPPISKLNPRVDADLLLVRGIKVPQDIIDETAKRYHQIRHMIMD